MSSGSEKVGYEDHNFPSKIGYRLTLAFGFLLLAVLLVGGFSLHLASSISSSTAKIKTITERIEHTDHIHFLMHHLIEEMNRIVTSPTPSRETKFSQISAELDEHIRHYKDVEAEIPSLEGRPHFAIFRMIKSELAMLVKATEKVRMLVESRQGIRQELASVRSLDNKMRKQFLDLNHLHKADISRELKAGQRRMHLISGIYLAFLVIGCLGLIAWRWAVSRAIVSPISNLASAALELARGNLDKRVPVKSKDEIGQLAHIFNFMTERIRDHEEMLKGLAALQERERIAQELHDNLAQSVGLLNFKIEEVEQSLCNVDTPSMRKTLREMRSIVDGAFDDIRQAIFGLRTMVSKSLGLIPTLTEYLHDFSQQRGITVDLKVDGNEAPELSAQEEIQVIRIIHEALTNVFKHAGATRSEVKFEREGNFCKVTIKDNGKGFRLGEVMKNGLHFGLKTMEERARSVNGDLRIKTEPAKGTKLVIYLPLEEKAHGNHPYTFG